MKKLILPFLTISCMALIFTAPSAQAKDKDKKDHHKNHGDHHDSWDDQRHGGNYNNDRVVYREVRQDDHRDFSYRSRYPRRVVVYESRSYGYNYYDLQMALRREGYYRGPIDGVWGPGSRTALIRYQSDRGWRRDGEVDGRLILHFGVNY